MIYMKHAEHGNDYFDDALQAELEASGWVRWPRTAEQKQGLASAASQLPADAVVPQVVPIKRGPGRPRKAA